jgi:hypothetical protein
MAAVTGEAGQEVPGLQRAGARRRDRAVATAECRWRSVTHLQRFVAHLTASPMASLQRTDPFTRQVVVALNLSVVRPCRVHHEIKTSASIELACHRVQDFTRVASVELPCRRQVWPARALLMPVGCDCRERDV